MNTKEKYKPSDLTRAYLDTLKEIKEPLQKMVKVGDLAPIVARIGVLRGYELGRKAGRKDMAKELKKLVKKEDDYWFSKARTTYVEKDKSAHLYYMGGHATLTIILEQLGEDEDGHRT